MALCGKLIGYVEVSKKGDIYNLFRYNPNEIAVISPEKVQGCDLHDGERGGVGSVISWHYTHVIIEAASDEKHIIVFKVIGGDLVDELYKTFTIILSVEKKGDKEVATWTFEFEKPDISVPYPTSMMDYLCDLVKDLDTYNSTK
ncbi:hypothetical protein Lser_V15G26313 [Lactuca serriola]